jgi:hypothetical protein
MLNGSTAVNYRHLLGRSRPTERRVDTPTLRHYAAAVLI